MRLPFPKRKFIFLLMTLLILLITFPLSTAGSAGRLLWDIGMSTTVLSSIYVVSYRRIRHIRKLLTAAGVLALLTFASVFSAFFTHLQWLGLLAACSGLAFFTFSTSVIMLHIFHETKVTADEIAAAISAYLMLGITLSFCYTIIEYLAPDSLAVTHAVARPPADRLPPHFGDYLYYSFTCLTTLGFGDVVPLSPATQAFSYLEAVTGQIYLTVLVARLVGLHLSQSG